jgi:hypothetical protein
MFLFKNYHIFQNFLIYSLHILHASTFYIHNGLKNFFLSFLLSLFHIISIASRIASNIPKIAKHSIVQWIFILVFENHSFSSFFPMLIISCHSWECIQPSEMAPLSFSISKLEMTESLKSKWTVLTFCFYLLYFINFSPSFMQ